jgi:hypothetical protein
MDVALNARIRHLGLACAEQARDPRCGYVLGRMLLRGDISEAQHGAGLRYAEDMSAWFGLCVGRFPSIRAQDLFAVHGVVSETEAQARMANLCPKYHARAHGRPAGGWRRQQRPSHRTRRQIRMFAKCGGKSELAGPYVDLPTQGFDLAGWSLRPGVTLRGQRRGGIRLGPRQVLLASLRMKLAAKSKICCERDAILTRHQSVSTWGCNAQQLTTSAMSWTKDSL